MPSEPQMAHALTHDDTVKSIRYRPVRVSPKTVWSFVELETADGIIGTGEATFFRGEHNFPQVVDSFAKQLVGRTLSDLADPALKPAEHKITDWAILSALEHAGWDIAGQRAGQPVHALLGTAKRAEVPIYANINRRTDDRSASGFRNSVRAARAQGFGTLKIAPFDGMMAEQSTDQTALFHAGLDRIRAAHDALQGQGTLMVDCHWRLTLDHAKHLLDLAADLGLGWVECALPETPETIPDLQTFAALARSAGVKLAGAEQGTSLAYFARIIDARVYDIIMPDVKYVGGIKRLLAISDLAAQKNVVFSPHNPSGPVAHLASLHAMAVAGNPGLLEHQFDEDPLFWTLGKNPLPQIHNSKSILPTQPGMGFKFAKPRA